MFTAEFFIFAAVVLVSAFLSVMVRSVLYAVFFQVQAVIAVVGILAGLNAKFVGFALLSMFSASIFVFLIFALIVFDFHKTQDDMPQNASKVSLLFFFLLAAETIYLFFKPHWVAEKMASDFSLPVFGNILYENYGMCVLVFGVLLLSCMIGITALLMQRKNLPAEGGEK